MKVDRNIIISLLFYVLAIVLSYASYYKFAIIILVFASVISLVAVKKIFGGYSNIVMLFVFFSILYGLSGPISVAFGEGLDDIFGYDFEYKTYLIVYALSQIFLLVSIFFFYQNRKSVKSVVTDDNIDLFLINRNRFVNSSILLMLLGTIFKLVNLYRIGGVSMLFTRKALYQAAESSLSLTLPGNEIILLSFVCFGLYISCCKKINIRLNYFKCIMILIIYIPIFIITLLLGQRGPLLEILLVLFLSIYNFDSLTSVKIKTVITVFIIYILLVFIYANRSLVPLLKTNPDLFFERIFDSKRIIDVINPSSNEFGCTYGNFNKYIISGDNARLYGRSYIVGLTLPIPSFLYPGDKPLQITYQFRNTYFPIMISRSRIASTGFSSLLEAYWNFGMFGVMFMYFIYGLLICKLNSILEKKKMFSSMLVIYISVFVISFSRTQLGGVINEIVYGMIYFTIFIYLPYSLKKIKNKEYRDEK